MVNVFGPSGEIVGGVGTIASILGTLLATTGPIAVGIIATLGTVAGVLAAVVGLGEAATDEIADQLEDAEDALACAIYNADGPEAAADAYRDALDEELSPGYAAVVKLTDISTGIKLLYGGRYDQQDIAQNIVDLGYDAESFTCDCAVIPDGEIYGIRFDVKRFNSEHSNGSLWRHSLTSTFGGIFGSSVYTVFTRSGIGGGTTQGVDLSPYVNVAIGNAACIADTSSDIEKTVTVNSPGSRDGDYWQGQVNNDNISPAKWCEAQFRNLQVWVSDDNGVTGVWCSATFSNRSSPSTGWTISDPNMDFYRDYTGFDASFNIDIVKGAAI
jgi:hypothetical protein